MTVLLSLLLAVGLPLALTLAYAAGLGLAPLPIWLVLVNLVLFVLLGWDKLAAQGKRRRTPELTLLALTFLGGTPALLAGMKIFKHKRRKESFTSALYAVIGAQVVVMIYFHRELWALL